MILRVFDDKYALGKASAAHAADAIRSAVARNGRARILAATGASQYEFLDALTASPDIAWQELELFHLDEYIGLNQNHPASFCKYLQDRLIRKTGIRDTHLLDGRADPTEAIRNAGEAIRRSPVDVAFVGIGENGHLAFNDPPADFETDEPYIVVQLDDACRQQQVGEGWFKTLSDVPQRAISISVRQILKSKEIICVVPDARKACAVQACIDGDVSPLTPASILKTHANATIYLDKESARLLRADTLHAFAANRD
jgi:glucosamine-6-phosphate deaminase